MNKIIKLFLTYLWLVGFFVLVLSDDFRYQVTEIFLTHKDFAIFLFIFIQVLFAILVLPCSTLTSIASLLWGFKLGFIISTISSITSAVVTFLLGQLLFKKFPFFKRSNFVKTLAGKVENYCSGYLASLLFVNPFLPGSSLGYVFAIMNYKFYKFFICALVGTVPLNLIFVLIGRLFIK